MSTVGKAIHAVGAPLWTPSMPKPYNASKHAHVYNDGPLKVVYFPSCINQAMGVSKGAESKRPLMQEMTELLHKAGYEVIFPDRMDALCCGTIWESKGLPEIADSKTRELEDALWKASEEGRYPVVCDQSPCLHRMKQKMTKVRLYEAAEFVWTFLKDRLEFHKTAVPVALHLTCSTRIMKIDKH